MAAWYEQGKKRKGSSGAYTITGVGISTSSVTLGAAISKAQTIASRLQRMMLVGEEGKSLYVRRIGEDALARVDVTTEGISTSVLRKEGR